MSVAMLIIGDDIGEESNIEKGGEKMTVKVVRRNTGETLMTLEEENLSQSVLELIIDKGIEDEDGDHLDFDPSTMKIVVVKDVICNNTDDCYNQACEHKEGHPENEMTDPCNERCGIFKDSECVPVKESDEEVKFQVIESSGECVTGPCVPPEIKPEIEAVKVGRILYVISNDKKSMHITSDVELDVIENEGMNIDMVVVTAYPKKEEEE